MLLRFGVWSAVGWLLIGFAVASLQADEAGPAASQEVETAQTLLDQGWVLRWERSGDALHVTHAARDAQRLFDAAEMVAAASLRHVRELHLSALTPAFSKAALAPLAQLSELEYLTLDGRGRHDAADDCLGDDHLQAIAALTALRRLNLGTVWFRGTAGLSALEALGGLNSLAIESPNLGDEQAEAIGRLPRLEELQIATKQALSERGIRGLARLADLRVLVLDGALKTDGPLAGLSTAKNLRKLVLAGLEITGEGFAALAGASNLEELVLYGCRISPDGLRAIQNCTSLRKLKLARCGPSPGASLDGLPPLRFAQLESLTLRWGLSLGLASRPEFFPALRALWLQGDHPTDRLGELSRLEALHLQQLGPDSYDKVLDEQVASLKALKHLSIRCANVSEAALARVGAMPAMRSLIVADSHIERLYSADSGGQNFVKWFEWQADRGAARTGESALPPVARGVRGLSVALPTAPLVDELKTASRLATLKVSGRTLNDQVLARVATLDTLAELSVEDAWSVTDVGVGELKALAALGTLRLDGLERVTSQAVAEVAGALQLQEFECYSIPLEAKRLVGLPVRQVTVGKQRPSIDHQWFIDDDDQLLSDDVFYYRARPLPGNLGTIDDD